MELKDVYGYNGNKTKAYTNRRARDKDASIRTQNIYRNTNDDSQNIGSQVIATTHSIEFIKIAMETSTKIWLEPSLIHIAKENGKLDIRKLSKPDTKLIMDLGIDPRLLDLF